MIYIGNNEISGIYLGNSEITGIYCGELQLYPMNLGILTGIAIENLVWVTDISANGGTATSANCEFDVYAYYDSGKRKRVTKDTTITGSLVVPSTTADTREMVGTLTLTASYSGFTDTDTVDVYQKAQSYNNIIIYTTTNNTQLVLPSVTWTQNIISHTFTNNTGRIQFDDDVTMIPDDAFSGCSTLQTINIPDTVTSYGARAFKNCTGMSEFHIKSGITFIGQACFYETTGDLTIESAYAATGGTGSPDSNVWGFAYRCCGSWGNGGGTNECHMNFDKVIITGETITNIMACAFHSSPATEYVIGDKVKTVQYMAFARMQGGDPAANKASVLAHKPLLTLTVGSGITSLDSFWLFYGPESLTRINYYPPAYNGSVTSGWFGSTRTASVHYKEGNTGKLNGLPSWFTVYYDL